MRWLQYRNHAAKILHTDPLMSLTIFYLIEWCENIHHINSGGATYTHGASAGSYVIIITGL